MPSARLRPNSVMDAVSPAAARRLSLATTRVQSGFLICLAIADLSVVSVQLRPVEGPIRKAIRPHALWAEGNPFVQDNCYKVCFNSTDSGNRRIFVQYS